VSPLYGKIESLDVSQPYGHVWPVTGINFPFNVPELNRFKGTIINKDEENVGMNILVRTILSFCISTVAYNNM
jgi:hypothetical protein